LYLHAYLTKHREHFFIYLVGIFVGNMDDYNFYQENVNLIKGVSKIWNISIHLAKSINDSDLNETIMIRSDYEIPTGANICGIWHKHKDCLLFISVMVNKRYIYYIIFRDEYHKDSFSRIFLLILYRFESI